ncbi:MAG: ankyrin repeat domain-containing protein [Candidatus Ozemobacteraceae bacterium]
MKRQSHILDFPRVTLKLGEKAQNSSRIKLLFNFILFLFMTQILWGEIDQGGMSAQLELKKGQQDRIQSFDFKNPNSPIRIRQPDHVANPKISGSISPPPVTLKAKVASSETDDSDLDYLLRKPVLPPKSKIDLLVDAIIGGNISSVSSILETKVSPNEKDTFGKAPLFYAIEEEKPKIIDLLLNFGANIEILDDGSTPLEIAVRRNHTPTVKSILDGGGLTKVHPSVVLEKGPILNKSWETRKQHLLSVAVAKSNWELFDLLVSKGLTVDKSPRSSSEKFFCPLHLAAQKSDAQTIQKLISLGIPANQSSSDGDFPLHVAAEKGNKEAVLCLLKNGADPNLKNSRGRIPAYCALEFGHNDLAEILSQQILFNNQEIFGWIEKRGGEKYLALLLKRGANPNITQEGGITPLHKAVVWGSLESVKLLASFGADLNARGPNGNTPLHDVVCAIYPWGAREQANLLNVLKFLLDKGAKTDVGNVNGNTPFHLCFYKNEGRPSEVIKALLGKNADVNAINYDHDTPLLLAERGTRSPEEIQLYAAEKIRVGAKNLAIKDLGVKLLLENGAKVNVIDKMGNTPLHLAVLSDHLLGVKLLLEKGASVNVKNNNGETPLDIALQQKYRGNDEIVTFLEGKNTSDKIILNFETENFIVLIVFCFLAGILYFKGFSGQGMSILSIGLAFYGFRDFYYSLGYADPFGRILVLFIMPRTLIPILLSMLLSIAGFLKKRGFWGWIGVIFFFSLAFIVFILPFVILAIVRLVGAKIHQ